MNRQLLTPNPTIGTDWYVSVNRPTVFFAFFYSRFAILTSQPDNTGWFAKVYNNVILFFIVVAPGS